MYLLFFLLSHDSPKKGLICKETKRSLLLQYIHQLTRFRNLLSIVMHLRRTNQDRGVDHLEVDPLEVDPLEEMVEGVDPQMEEAQGFPDREMKMILT